VRCLRREHGERSLELTREIATFLEIDPETLRKHFRPELDRCSIEATAKVAQSLFRMASEGNNVAAAIF
jgi:N-acetylglucosamine kinase-like BadF-type ATPase